MPVDLIVGVISTLLTDAIYYGYKKAKQLTRKSGKAYNNAKERVEEFIRQYEGTIIQSGEFMQYLESPQIIDTIRNYVLYIAMRKYNKGQRTLKNKEDVIEYLSSNAYGTYDMQLTIPSKNQIKNFFIEFFRVCEEYYYEILNINEKSVIYFINKRIDDVEDIITKGLEEKVHMQTEQYDDIQKRYYSVVKKKNNTEFVYGFKELRLDEFYVIPVLRKNGENEQYFSSLYELEKEEITRFYSRIVCDYTKIFNDSNFIYIIGGPGYGKSILLKNIVVNYNKLEAIEDDKYLVIYCDLKTYYKNAGGRAYSITEFLAESIVEESGMSRTEINEDFIKHYLQIGRVIVLFDALDEVPKRNREKLHKMITSYFLTLNPNNKICITSRARGFLPQNDIEVFSILPLDRKQVNQYLDGMIKLGYFKKEYKNNFMRQADSLIEKNFLSSFLVLSLLVNIFRAEHELPKTKVELYNKCFGYMAKDRELGGKKEYNEEQCQTIAKIMTDSTFIELSKLACPNNKSINEEDIIDTLSKLYKSKFGGIGKAEDAIILLLKFCSERTELIVPAQADGQYKFFHRSFFEYFYAKYIMRMRSPEEIIKEFKKFDVDSEIYELTIAMLKNSHVEMYQQLIEYVLNAAENELKTACFKTKLLDLLILIMPSVDDEEYLHRFCELLINYSELFISRVKKIGYNHTNELIVNDKILYHTISEYLKKNNEMYNQFYDHYKKYAFEEVVLLWNFLCDCFDDYKQAVTMREGTLLYILSNVFFATDICFHSEWKEYFKKEINQYFVANSIFAKKNIITKKMIKEVDITVNKIKQMGDEDIDYCLDMLMKNKEYNL